MATEKLEEMAIEFFSNRFEYEVLRPYIGIGFSKFELPLVKDIPTSVMKKYARNFFKKNLLGGNMLNWFSKKCAHRRLFN